MQRIAFLGLGNMGAPMARNLLKAGHGLTVFDIVAAARESFHPWERCPSTIRSGERC